MPALADQCGVGPPQQLIDAMETEACVAPHLLARQRVQLGANAPGYCTEQPSLAPLQPSSEPLEDINGRPQPIDTIPAARRPRLEEVRKPLYTIEAKQLWDSIALQAAARINGHSPDCAATVEPGTACVQVAKYIKARIPLC